MNILSGQFYGTTVQTRAFSGFVLADTEYPPGMEIEPHTHERSYVSFVLHGSYTERDNNRIRRCDTGAIIVHPPGETHADRFGEDGGRVLSLEMPFTNRGFDPHCPERDSEAEYYEVANLMSRFEGELAFGDNYCTTFEALGFELAGVLERTYVPEQKPPRWLGEVVELLQDRFHEPLSLQQIAAAMDVHPVHLARTFRMFMGCTVGNYLRYIRVAFARRRLAESSLSIVEIAHCSGFSDQSHLCRVFRRQTGMTPSQFRSAIK